MVIPSCSFYKFDNLYAFVSYCQLKAHPETYEGYVPMEYADYLKRMTK